MNHVDPYLIDTRVGPYYDENIHNIFVDFNGDDEGKSGHTVYRVFKTYELARKHRNELRADDVHSSYN